MILVDSPPACSNTLRLLLACGLRPHVLHRSTSDETVRSMVARGFGYSLSLQQTMSDISYEGLRLVHRDILPPLNAEPVVLSRHVDTEPTHRALAVEDVIRNMIS